MADQPLRIYKAGAEAISTSEERLGVGRQTIDVLSSEEGEAPILVFKFGAEMICRVPPELDFTRQSIDVIATQEGEAGVEIYKFGGELIYTRPPGLNITRQAIDVLASEDGDNAIQIYKMGLEIVCKASPSLVAPQPEPSFWEVFGHNWVDSFELETEYQTDITKSASTLTEDRRSLAGKPFRTAKIRWTALGGNSLDRLLVSLRKLSSERMFSPLYSDYLELTQDASGPDTQLYCDPSTSRVFVNQRIAILTLGEDLVPDGTVYLREIDDIEIDHLVLKTALPFVDFIAGKTVIFPLMDTEILLDPQAIQISDKIANVTLTFQEIPGTSALPPVWTGHPENAPEYQGYPVFHFEPDWSKNPKLTYKKEGKKEKQGRGFVVFSKGDRYALIHNFELGMERADFFEYLQFFDSRRGRFRAFWLIDLDHAWEFIAISGVSNTFIDIEVTGDFDRFEEDLDYIGIVTRDGNYYVREVVGAQDLTNYYRVTVTEALPEIEAVNVIRVARARLSRYVPDVLKERWTTNQYVNIDVKTTEILNEETVEM